MVVGEDTSKVGDEGSYMVRREELDGRAKRRKASGKQLGDRSKAARAMLQVIDNDAPPAHRLCVHRSDYITQPISTDQVAGRYDQPGAGSNRPRSDIVGQSSQYGRSA